MRKKKALVIIQKCLKKKINVIKILKCYKEFLLQLLQSITQNFSMSEKSSIISQRVFLMYMKKLELLYDKTRQSKLLRTCRDVHAILQKYALEYGTHKLKHLFWRDAFNRSNICQFYNKYFQSVEIELKIGSKSTVECIPSERVYASLYAQLHSATLIIPIEHYHMVVQGYFHEPHIAVYRNIFSDKYQKLYDHITQSTRKINMLFIKSYLKQLTTATFCSMDVNDICQTIEKDYAFLEEIKNKTISELVKLFLTSSEKTQRKILILLLINIEDGETDHLAFLLYDMISNKTFIMTTSDSKPDIIFYTLHWSVQEKLAQQLNLSKDAIKDVMENSRMSMDAVSYEKQIVLMRTSDAVKSKAFAKLKEIKNSKGDSNVKATQYLDALLTIPFGIYRKEPIKKELDKISSQMQSWCDKCIALYVNGSKTFLSEWLHMVYVECVRFNQQKRTTYYSLHNLFKKIDADCMDIFDKSVQKIMNGYSVAKLRNLADAGNFSLSQRKSKSKIIKELMQDRNTILHLFQNKKDPMLMQSFVILEKYIAIHQDWQFYKSSKIEHMNEVNNTLDSAVYGLDDAKMQIKRVVAQWSNGEDTGYVFGFEGPMGTGKTTLAKKGVADCLKDLHGKSRPFQFIALGGSTNGSTLEGHNYTYVGSTWGKIVDCLMSSKCMNPIIYIDELDKISNTEQGREIIGILIHLTDPSQNEEFTDRYFRGIPINLSKCLIIFSYNDPSRVDKILLDRIHRIKTKALTKYEKTHISKCYIIPELLDLVGFCKGDIIFANHIIHTLIESYTAEAGVRKLKEKLLDIIRHINLNITTGQDYTLPLTITQEMVSTIFDRNYKYEPKKIMTSSKIGIVNGLYASNHSLGGITLIQAFKCWGDKNFDMKITGQQGDVMKESIRVAKTIAWGLLLSTEKKRLLKQINFGIHIHCPETSTPKDGPSAGAAITIAIMSLFLNIPVVHTCAMTGEIDLDGNVMKIGGLSAKLEGARQAGVRTVLIPQTNQTDLDIIKKYEPHFVENSAFSVIPVKTIYDVFPHMFGKMYPKIMKKIHKKIKPATN